MIRQNDATARRILLKKYALLVEKFTFEVVKSCKNIDIEDIRQELYMCFLNVIENYDDEGNFFSYLYSCLQHKSINLKRSFFRTPTKIASSIDKITEGIDRKYGTLLEDDCCVANPRQIFSVREKKEEFQTSYHCLSTLEKKVMKLYNLGYSREDTCAELQISKKQLDNALNRAKTKLKIFVKEEK